jgi:hypothetical protein
MWPSVIVDAHHLADHRQRQQRGGVGDEIDLAALADVVDDVGGDLADVALHRVDGAGGEALVDEAA